MSTPFNITEATSQYARNKCIPQLAPTNFGQIKYAISCLPSNATSAEGIDCIKPNKIPNDADCQFMVKGGWDSITKRAEEPKFYCYTLCQELRTNNAAISSGTSPLAASSTAKNASNPAATTSVGASPPASAGLTLYPNVALSFFALLFFMFVFFKPKH